MVKRTAAQFHQYYLYPETYHTDYNPPTPLTAPPISKDERDKVAPDALPAAVTAKANALKLIQSLFFSKKKKVNV